MPPAVLALLLTVAAPAAAPHAAGDELGAVQRDCIAAAADVQRQERMIPLLEHAVELLGRDIAGRQRGLDESRREQALLLGAIERVALHPLDGFGELPAAPVDRLRAVLLRDAIAPALRSQAQALVGEIARIAALRADIASRDRQLAATRQQLAAAREHLAELVGQRTAALRRLLPGEAVSAAQLARIGHDAKDVGELIRLADAAIERHDKALAPRGRTAATKPMENDDRGPPRQESFDPAAARLTMPVAAAIRGASAADAASPSGQGIALATVPAATVVAPYDGRVSYAGPFDALGLVLIIRHGGLYHSLLAGLGRVDVRVGDRVLAGEPVAAMPDKPDVALQLELRRDGRPVDPQPWLAGGSALSDQGDADRRDEAHLDGDQKVGK